MTDRKVTPKSSGKLHRQYAALPVRVNADGQAEILLVTSRGRQRWIIPKGWPMRKMSPSEAAAREAFEEAGLEGEIETDEPIGSYVYAKRLPSGVLAQIEVSIYLLRVVRQLAMWPEKAQRQTRWFEPSEAAEQVAEPELALILRSMTELVLATA